MPLCAISIRNKIESMKYETGNCIWNSVFFHPRWTGDTHHSISQGLQYALCMVPQSREPVRAAGNVHYEGTLPELRILRYGLPSAAARRWR